MSELEHELFLFVVEDNGTGEEAASTWDRRVACGPGCRKGWWKGFRSCCPPPAKPEMNWRVWSMLTADLLERVLERLPASSQARSQVVCNKWRSLLTSPAFLHRSALVAVSSGLSPCVVWDTTQGSLESLQQSVFPRLQRLRLDVLCDYIWEYDGSWFDDHVFTGVRKGEQRTAGVLAAILTTFGAEGWCACIMRALIHLVFTSVLSILSTGRGWSCHTWQFPRLP